MNELEGRKALVTGSGRGIGRAIAIALARAGADVALSSRSKGEIEAVAKEVEALGREAFVRPADATRADDVRGLVADTLSAFGRIDILVNNAGGVYYEDLADIMPATHDDALFEEHVFFNLTSAYLATRHALPKMIENDHGRVIFIGSGYAKTGGGPIGYTAGKHGLVGLMRAMVHQIPTSITVNTLCPGWTNTKLANDYFEEGAKALGTTAKALREQAESENVQKRLVEPEELGPMAVLLASDASAAITGQVISVDGGYKI